MLRSDTLFGKRDSNATTANTPLGTTGLIPTGPGLAKTVSLNSNTTNEAATGSTTESATSSEGGSKLIVGPNIKLKGVEITDCDTLVVEGRVEATIDSRVIQIAERGAFKGSAEFDIAEIRGEFDGELTVRQKLVVYATGKVTGKVRYGKVVIEEGGQLSGDVQVGAAAATKVLSVAKAG